MNVLIAMALSSLLAAAPLLSYSETIDYEMHGWGYGLIGSSVTDASVHLDMTREAVSNRATFEHGQLSIGDNSKQINRLDILFLQNDRVLRLSGAATDGTMMAAAGRLLAANEYGTVYDLRGNVVKNGISERIFLYVTLQHRQTPVSPVDEQNTPPIGDSKQDVLLLVRHSNVVEWKSKYEFTVRVFDPQTNPGSNFYHSFGFLKGVKISAKITNPAGNTINTINGTTDDSGYFVGSMIIPDNSLRGTYRLDVQISDDAFKTKSERLNFEVIPV